MACPVQTDNFEEQTIPQYLRQAKGQIRIANGSPCEAIIWWGIVAIANQQEFRAPEGGWTKVFTKSGSRFLDGQHFNADV